MAISKLILNGVTQMDVTDTTATADKILTSYGAYGADGVWMDGTASGGGGGQYPWAGANATLVKTFDSKTFSLADTSYATWTPSTTGTIILAPQELGTYTVTDLSTHDYFIVVEFDLISVYPAQTTMMGALVRSMYSGIQASYGYLSNLTALTSGTPSSYTNRSPLSTNMISYYNTSGTLAAYAGQYGIYANSSDSLYSTSGSFSSLTYTVKTPNVYVRCHNTYFSTTLAAEIDQDQTKFKYIGYIVKSDRGSFASQTVNRMAEIYDTPL